MSGSASPTDDTHPLLDQNKKISIESGPSHPPVTTRSPAIRRRSTFANVLANPKPGPQRGGSTAGTGVGTSGESRSHKHASRSHHHRPKNTSHHKRSQRHRGVHSTASPDPQQQQQEGGKETHSHYTSPDSSGGSDSESDSDSASPLSSSFDSTKLLDHRDHPSGSLNRRASIGFLAAPIPSSVRSRRLSNVVTSSHPEESSTSSSDKKPRPVEEDEGQGIYPTKASQQHSFTTGSIGGFKMNRYEAANWTDPRHYTDPTHRLSSSYRNSDVIISMSNAAARGEEYAVESGSESDSGHHNKGPKQRTATFESGGDASSRRPSSTSTIGDVCLPVDSVEDYDPDTGKVRQWPDLSVLEEWSQEERKTNKLANNDEELRQRIKNVYEADTVQGRLRPVHSALSSHLYNLDPGLQDKSKYRFTYFREDLKSTIHSQTISELVQPGQTFANLFAVDAPIAYTDYPVHTKHANRSSGNLTDSTSRSDHGNNSTTSTNNNNHNKSALNLTSISGNQTHGSSQHLHTQQQDQQHSSTGGASVPIYQPNPKPSLRNVLHEPAENQGQSSGIPYHMRPATRLANSPSVALGGSTSNLHGQAHVTVAEPTSGTSTPATSSAYATAKAERNSAGGGASPSYTPRRSATPHRPVESTEMPPPFWLDVMNPTDHEIRVLSKAFGIHPLTAEDIATGETREKVELFRTYYLVSFRSFVILPKAEYAGDIAQSSIIGGAGGGGSKYGSLSNGNDNIRSGINRPDSIRSDQSSIRKRSPRRQGWYQSNDLQPLNMYMVVFKDGILSFHFEPTQHPVNVRRRIRQLQDYLTVSADWISYALIDDITDAFAPLIEIIENEVYEIDEEILKMNQDSDSDDDGKNEGDGGGDGGVKSGGGRHWDNDSILSSSTTESEEWRTKGDMLRRIGECRKRVMVLSRLLGNKADVIKGFSKRCNENWEAAPRSEIGLYLGDIQDHVVTMVQSLNHYEQLLARSHSNYLALINIDMTRASNETNDTLGRLTILGTMVLPMNVITGLWGMNVKVPGQDIDSLTWFYWICSFLGAFTVISVLLAKRLYGL